VQQLGADEAGEGNRAGARSIAVADDVQGVGAERARGDDHPFVDKDCYVLPAQDRLISRAGLLLDHIALRGLRVETNPITGSLLVEHEGEIADLVMQAFGADIGDLVEIALNAPPVAQRLASEITAIDRNIRDFTGGEIDLRTLASIGLLAMAAIQLIAGQQPAIAVTVGWYASELLRRSANAPTNTGAG
jgi:hypothetical protein